MLEVKNLVFRPVDNGIEKSIIDGISFQVGEGEMLVITGPNGGGKSTMAKLLMGIETPDAGQILLDGKDITGYSIAERAGAGIGFAFQQPPRFKGMTVARFLSLAAGKELPEKVCCDLLSSVGLCAREYIDREINGSLSGGELKRIEIAMILARGTKLSIFDEPEAALSPMRLMRLMYCMKELVQKNSQFIVSTHSPILMTFPGAEV